MNQISVCLSFPPAASLSQAILVLYICVYLSLSLSLFFLFYFLFIHICLSVFTANLSMFHFIFFSPLSLFQSINLYLLYLTLSFSIYLFLTHPFLSLPFPTHFPRRCECKNETKIRIASITPLLSLCSFLKGKFDSLPLK